MEARRYTVKEIDWMREMIANSVLAHPKNPADCIVVEERLRTFMMHGTAPEELAEQYGPGFGPYK